MKMSDVLIHVNETIEDVGRSWLEEALRDMEGVVTSHFSPQHSHLMFVAYDPDFTPAAAILGQVRERGYGAQIPDRGDLIQQSEIPRHCRRLGAVDYIQQAKDGGEVCLDGALFDIQFAADELVGFAFRQ